MVIDYQQPSVAGVGVIVYPDIAVLALPIQPSNIKETVVIMGSTSSNSVSITGESGPEQQ